MRGPRFLLASSACVALAACMALEPLDPPPHPSNAGGASGASGTSGAPGASGAPVIGGASGAGGADDEGGAAGAPAEGPCTTNAECSARNLDEKYRCRNDGVCVPLATLECPLVYGDSNDENAVFIGAFGTREGASLAESTSVYTYRLAIDEFQRADNLPGTGRDRRALVTIVCDNDRAQFDAGMRHLTEEVRVPAILATVDTDQLLSGFRKYGQDEVFFLSPFGGSRELTSEMDNGLIWSMLGQPADFAPVYAAFLARLEQYVLRTFPTIENLRVAAVRSTDSFSAELADSVLEELRFNGKSVADNFDEGNFIVNEIPVDGDPLPAIEEAVTAINTFKPHVVLSLANEVFTAPSGVMPQVEETWRAVNETQPRPFWVMSPKNTDGLDAAIGRIVLGQTVLNPSAYQRFLAIGAAPAEDRTLYDAFRLRLLAKFPKARVEAENLYDAFYFLVYALYGAGNVPELTGPGVARGMLRLMSADASKAVDVGPLAIGDAFQLLTTQTNTIRLMGTLGPPNFDTAVGVRVDAGSVSCFDENAVLHYHVLRYDRESGLFDGSFEPCFSAF